MRRSELEHVIGASGAIADDRAIIIIGSQSILGQFPDVPVMLLASMVADIYPKNKAELAQLIDGSIGEGSFFHAEYGYYAQGVGSDTAVLPDGWQNRLVGINNENTNGVTGLCLEVHDLAISKYVAGRPKDMEFTGELARHKMIEYKTLLERLGKTDLSSAERSRIKSSIDSNFRTGGRAYGAVVLNAFFVSDLHIGSPTDSRATLFLEFLKKLSGKESASHLFLMGDIFDLWIAAHRYFIDKFRPIIDEIVRLRDEGVEIHYFEGNHDLYLRHYWSDEMGFTVHEGPAYFELGHQTVRIEHGDQMDTDDRGYRILRWFLRTPPLKFLMPRLPGRLVVMIGKKSSEISRVYTSETKTMTREETIRKIRTHAKTVHAQMPFNLIISGHVHVRDEYLVRDDQIAFKSVNLGTWLDAPCYYQIDDTGGRLVELTDTP